jgi:hypothetical protein
MLRHVFLPEAHRKEFFGNAKSLAYEVERPFAPCSGQKWHCGRLCVSADQSPAVGFGVFGGSGGTKGTYISIWDLYTMLH